MQDNICFALLAFRASLREESGWGGDIRTVNVDVLVWNSRFQSSHK